MKRHLVVTSMVCLLSIFDSGAALFKQHDDTDIGKLKSSFTKKNCEDFVKYFPGSFKDFCIAYDYNESNPNNNLYKNYQEHIGFLFDCSLILNEKNIEKIVNISINAEWRADAVSLFQDKEINIIYNKTDNILNVLNKKPLSQQRSFWHFIFDGSPPHDKQVRNIYDRMYSMVSKKDALQAQIMKEEFYKMYRK